MSIECIPIAKLQKIFRHVIKFRFERKCFLEKFDVRRHVLSFEKLCNMP